VTTKTHNASYLAAMTPAQRTWLAGYPVWMEAAWALGVWGALLGSILLLGILRRTLRHDRDAP